MQLNTVQKKLRTLKISFGVATTLGLGFLIMLILGVTHVWAPLPVFAWVPLLPGFIGVAGSNYIYYQRLRSR